MNINSGASTEQSQSCLNYAEPQSGILGGSTLVFEIELLGINYRIDQA